MKATDYNKYPEWMKKPFNKTVIYTFHDIKSDPDNPGKYIIPNIYRFKCIDQIVVTDEDGTNARPIHIAYTNGSNPDGSIVVGDDLYFSAEGFGRIVLNPKKASDHAKFMFMEYSNQNGSNPNRDESTPIVWTKQDLVVKAKTSRTDRKKRKEALLEAVQLSPYMVGVLINVLGSSSDSDKSEEEQRDIIEDIAENDPKTFLAAVKSTLSEIISTTKKAKDLGIIKNDFKKQAFISQPDDEVIWSTKGIDKKKTYELFARYLQENPKVLKTIESKVLLEEELV
tara:strand:- start:45 stop:893 length:849 start_codon:yes stop_codon:yes gene_type:complete